MYSDADGKAAILRDQVGLLLIRNVQYTRTSCFGGICDEQRVFASSASPTRKRTTTQLMLDDFAKCKSGDLLFCQPIHEIVMRTTESAGTGQRPTANHQNLTRHQPAEPMLILNGQARACAWTAIRTQRPAYWW